VRKSPKKNRASRSHRDQNRKKGSWSQWWKSREQSNSHEAHAVQKKMLLNAGIEPTTEGSELVFLFY